MVSLEQQERVVFLNSQYQDNSELIERLYIRLLKDIHTLDLSIKDLSDTQAYIQDKVTIFRFLRDCNFDFEKSHERLLKSILWRIEKGIADLSFESCLEFFEPEAFAFFHKTDSLNRPLVFVRLRFFPIDHKHNFIGRIERFALLMMEMARKLTWDITCEREKKDDPCVLVSQITAVVNLQNGPLLPFEPEIIKVMSVILDDMFPCMISSINVLNFGWMYHGIWTVVKLLLSEEAKNSIKFTSVNELKPFIHPDSILQEMGGNDTFRWSLESDKILQKYGIGHTQELPHTPPISEDSSKSNLVSDDEEDIFFDANDILPSIPLSPTIPEHPIPLNTPLTSRAGLRMGTDFLTSFIDTDQPEKKRKLSSIEQVYQPSSVIVVNGPLKKASIGRLKHVKLVSKRLSHRLLQLTFGKQKGVIYWILLYFFLRGPVERLVHKSLQRTMLKPNYYFTTTVGITAVVATVFSTSISSTVEKYNKKVK